MHTKGCGLCDDREVWGRVLQSMNELWKQFGVWTKRSRGHIGGSVGHTNPGTGEGLEQWKIQRSRKVLEALFGQDLPRAHYLLEKRD